MGLRLIGRCGRRGFDMEFQRIEQTQAALNTDNFSVRYWRDREQVAVFNSTGATFVVTKSTLNEVIKLLLAASQDCEGGY